MATAAQETAWGLRFGLFEVDPRTGELRRDGLRVRLQDQPFQVLALLLERPGEVVTRDELRERLWPADTFVSFDQGLNNAVRRLRDALGDSAEAPRYVETLPRLGYRFIAPVERFPISRREPAAVEPVPSPAAAGEETSHGRFPAVVLIGLSIAMGAALTAAALAFVRRPAADPPLLRHLTHSGHDHAPAFSPDGRTAAFASERDGRRRIWLTQLATGEEAAITDGPLDGIPRFSPDGASVVFVRIIPGEGTSLYRVPVLGGEARRLLPDARGGGWSPDGRQLAFLRYGRGSQQEHLLGVAGADGSNARELTRLQGLWVTPPRWSPDGRWIAVTHGEGGDGVWSVLALEVATGRKILLSPPSRFGNLSPAVWSRSGRALIYAQEEPEQVGSSARIVRQEFPSGRTAVLLRALGTSTAGLDVAAPDRVLLEMRPTRGNLREESLAASSGSARRWLTGGFSEDRQPTYSRDGSRLVFTSNRGGNVDLWELTLGSGRLRRLTDDAAVDRDPHLMSDGRLLWSSKRTGRFEVWMAAPDGSTPRQVSRDGFDAENPAATLDGSWIVYASSNPHRRGLWKVRPDGSEATRLVAATVGLPEISPDGDIVVFSEYEPPFTTLRAVTLADGAPTGFATRVRMRPTPTREASILGRARWLADGRTIAFVNANERGRTGVSTLLYRPEPVDIDTARPLAGFEPDLTTESFGVSPDGRRIAIATRDSSSNLVLASGVPGLDR